MNILKHTIVGLVGLYSIVCSTTASGQKFPQPKSSNISTILSDKEADRFMKVIEKGLVVFQQYYALRSDDGTEYGRNRNEYYGRTHAIGYKVGKYIVTSPSVLSPWDLDASYQKIDTLAPFVTKSMYRQYDSKTKLDTSDIAPKDSLAVFLPTDSTQLGFMLADSLVATGRFVYFYSDNSTEKAIKKSVQEPIQVKWSKNQTAESPFIINMPVVIGGAFFEEKIISPGVIHYRLVGIMAHNGQKWLLRSLVLAKPKPVKTNDNGLNPIGGKKKSKGQTKVKNQPIQNPNPDDY